MKAIDIEKVASFLNSIGIDRVPSGAFSINFSDVYGDPYVIDADLADPYEDELAKAEEWARDTLREECNGDPTTVWAFLNDCLSTRNDVLRDLLVQYHGEAQGMQDWVNDV